MVKFNLEDLDIGKNAPDIVNCIIEIPKDTNAKIEYDPELRIFKLDRFLISSMRYPLSYGFIPQTIGEDDDPLDIVIYGSQPVPTGIVVECRIIGGLNMEDKGVKDYKLMAVPLSIEKELDDITKIEHNLLNITKDFFRNYKNMHGKRVLVKNWFGKSRAQKIISMGHIKYLNENKHEASELTIQ